jgi:hypothetical protein
MNTFTALKILNPILGVIFLYQALTGLFHDFLSPDTFELIHKIGGVSLIIGVTTHVIFNGKWIRATFFSK